MVRGQPEAASSIDSLPTFGSGPLVDPQGVRENGATALESPMMMETWRPCPDSLIDEDAERVWEKGNPCPASTAWLWCWRRLRDGKPISVRKVMSMTAWGSTRSRRLLSAVRAAREAWGENDANTVATHLQHGSDTAPTRPDTVEPTESGTGNTAPTRRQHGGDTPSRAQSIVDRERTEQKTDDAAEAWTALCRAVGREWNLDPRWRRWLTQGAKSLGGWDAWHLIARWVAEGGPDDGDAAFHRETRRDPETLIRASSRAKWHNQARDWAKSRGIVATAEKPKHNGKPAPQMPKDVKDYRYLMTMTHPWGLPKEITDLWAHEDSTYTWEVPPYED